jgi:hypothetical protein
MTCALTYPTNLARVFVPMLLLALPEAARAQELGAVGESYPSMSVRIPDRDVYHRRDPIPVSFQSDRDGYVTVLRVDTDGRVRILFPADPYDDNFVRGGREYRVPNPYGYDVEHAFAVDDYPGVGYVFAVVSLDAFDYRPYMRNAHWDYRTLGIDGRITGDPYVALSEIVEYMLPPGYVTYGFDVAPYFVETRYEYPRFVCYDCHAYTAYPVWDPYRDWCGTFKLVIYDDPGWYPATVYPARRVVPAGAGVRPQFVIKGRTATEPHVVHVTRSGSRGAQPETGVRGRDLGGVGAVRAPREREAGGVGGLLRRLFGKDRVDAKRRPADRDLNPPSGEGTRPTLERRKKNDTQQGTLRRPNTNTPSGARRPAVRSGSTSRSAPVRPKPSAPGRKPAQKPTSERRRRFSQ